VSLAAGVHDRRGVDAGTLRNELRRAGWRVFTLPEGIADGASFVEAVRSTMPMDPPPSPVSTHSWDALLDSMSGGLYDAGMEPVALIWPGSSVMAEAAPAEFRTAKDVLDSVARRNERAEDEPERPIRFAAILA
jgi:Barstar (barnase inhibitor)